MQFDIIERFLLEEKDPRTIAARRFTKDASPEAWKKVIRAQDYLASVNFEQK